jgi:hypothetical protein
MKKLFLTIPLIAISCSPKISHATHGNNIIMGSFMGAGMGAALGGYDGILPGMITGLAVGTTAELLEDDNHGCCYQEVVYSREIQPSRQWLEDQVDHLEHKLQKKQQRIRQLEHELEQKNYEIHRLRKELKKLDSKTTQKQEILISAKM